MGEGCHSRSDNLKSLMETLGRCDSKKMLPLRSSISEGGCRKQLVPWEVLQTGPERGDWLFWEPWNKQTRRIQHAVTLSKLKNSSNVTLTFNTAAENKPQGQEWVLTETTTCNMLHSSTILYCLAYLWKSLSVWVVLLYSFSTTMRIWIPILQTILLKAIRKRGNPCLETKGEGQV